LTVLVAASAAAVILAGIGSAVTIDLPWLDRKPASLTAGPPPPKPMLAVLGETEERPVEPPAATADMSPPVLAEPSPPSTTTTSTVPPSTTTSATSQPSTTTSTTQPRPITPASASASAPGVVLTLDVSPASGARSLELSLAARFADARVLRAVRADLGDGTVVDGKVEPWACNAPGAPNPYVLSLPAHTYRSPGTYRIRILATTAACSPDDDDWGVEQSAEVQLSVVVP
jgi:hypothetical protein